MDNLKERSLRVQKEEKSRPRWFLFRAPAGRPDPHLPVFFVLLYSVILGLRPCWGADMRGRIVNNIFLCSGWCGSGFPAGGRGFRPPPFSASSPVSCLGLSNTTDWYVKPRGCSCQVGCERKNRYRIPAWFGFFPFLDPQKSFFQVRIRIRILLCEIETVRLLILTVICCKW